MSLLELGDVSAFDLELESLARSEHEVGDPEAGSAVRFDRVRVLEVPVPEPSTGLLGLGLAGVAVMRRRRS